jgi:hypothetical protein
MLPSQVLTAAAVAMARRRRRACARPNEGSLNCEKVMRSAMLCDERCVGLCGAAVPCRRVCCDPTSAVAELAPNVGRGDENE